MERELVLESETYSMVMRAYTRTIRFIKTIHYLPNKAGHHEEMTHHTIVN